MPWKQRGCVLLIALLVPVLAEAAGQEIPDLGANALGEGGAWIAHPTDGAAIYYNPAGLAAQPGLNIMLDGRLMRDAVSFQRASTPDGQQFNTVSNAGGASVAPMAVISYRVNISRLFPVTFAIGGHPFSGGSGYQYPDPTKVAAKLSPSDPNYDSEVAQATPQRYSSIVSHNVIYVPVIAVAAQVTPWLAVGVGFQAPIASISTREAIYAGLMSGETPSNDAVFSINTQDWFRPSGLFGVSARLRSDLFAGASFQLPTRFHAQGTITASIPPALQSLGVSVKGDQADLDITFPWVARLGVRYVREHFEIELAGTYEAWSMQNQIVLTPKNVTLTVFGLATPLAPVILHTDLQDAGSIRLGAVLRGGLVSQKLEPFSLRLGLLGETSAVPEQRQTVSIPDWQRVSASIGVGMTFRNYDFALSYAHIFQPQLMVTDSQAEQPVAFKTFATPTIIGNGTYNAQVDMLAAVVSAHFL